MVKKITIVGLAGVIFSSGMIYSNFTAEYLNCRRARNIHVVQIFFDKGTMDENLIVEAEKDFGTDAVKEASSYLKPDRKLWIRAGSYDVGIIDENAARASSGEIKAGDYVITLNPKYYANEKQRDVLLEWMIYDLVVSEKFGLFSKFEPRLQEISRMRFQLPQPAFSLGYFYQRYSHALTLIEMIQSGKVERAYKEASRIISVIKEEQLPKLSNRPVIMIPNYIANYIGIVMPFVITGQKYSDLENNLNVAYALNKRLPLEYTFGGKLSPAVEAVTVLLKEKIESGDFVPLLPEVWDIITEWTIKTTAPR